MIINTQSAQYQKLYNGLATLHTVMAPRIKLLSKLSTEKQVTWLKEDPLMKRYLKMVEATVKHVNLSNIREEVQDG